MLARETSTCCLDVSKPATHGEAQGPVAPQTALHGEQSSSWPVGEAATEDTTHHSVQHQVPLHFIAITAQKMVEILILSFAFYGSSVPAQNNTDPSSALQHLS